MRGRHTFSRWLLVLSVIAIVVATLTPVPGSGQGPGTRGLCIICHERAFADFLSNVILFAPLGLALAARGRSLLIVAAAGLLFSAFIEFMQVERIHGRDANLGDVVSNGTGAVVGWLLWRTRAWWLHGRGGAWRPLLMTGAGGSLLLAALSLFRPDLPEREWFLQWTPELGGLAHYQGQVLATRLRGVPLEGPGSIARSDTVRTLLFTPDWLVDMRAGPPPEWIAPIVSIYDGRKKEMMLLGAYGNDLVYRQRLRATSRRFDAADLRIEEAFADVRAGDTVRVQYRADAAHQCVLVERRERCTTGYTIGDTWSLLMFPDSWGGTARRAMACAWVFGLFSLAGFTAPRGRALIGPAVLIAGGLTAAPALMGFAFTPLAQTLAALAGLAAGFVASRRVRSAIGAGGIQTSAVAGGARLLNESART